MKLGTRSFAVLLVALVSFTQASVGAAAQDDEAEGRKRFRRGEELYVQGKFLEAAREFEAGYAAAPRFPRFLLNIGHAYRRGGELLKAKDAYQRLLKLQPDFQKRAEVEEYIKSIDDALQAGETQPEPQRPAATPATPTPMPLPPPPPSVTLVDPVLTAPSSGSSPNLSAPAPSAPSVMETAQPPADSGSSGSLLAKPWFWILAGAVIAGTVTGVYFATRPPACPATLCIKE